MILKYPRNRQCGAQCSCLLSGMYSVQLYKITYCNALQQKYIFIFSGTSKYSFLQFKKEIRGGKNPRTLKRIIRNYWRCCQTLDHSPVNMNDVSIVHSPLFHGLECLLCAHTEAQHVQIHHFLEVVR